MSKMAIRAGAAAIDITPGLGGSIAGYMADRRSVRIHDPLQIKCLVLDNGQEKLAVAVCDLIAIARAQVQAARHLIHSHTGIPLHNTLISATHTHSGATPVPLFQSDPDPRYMEWVVTRIADGVRMAAANLQPARIGSNTAPVPGLVFNRRFHMKPGTIPPNPFGGVDQVQMNPGYQNPNIIRPAGPTDPELALLGVQTASGEPLALLSSYALHYVGHNPSDEISADYFGMWSQEIARALGQFGRVDDQRPAFVAMLANACSGDINNIDVSRPSKQAPPYEQMRGVAGRLAEATLSAWNGIKWTDAAPLSVAEASLMLGIRKPSAEALARAREILSQAGSKLESTAEIYARESVLLAERPDTVEVPMQAMRLGDLGVITFPGEAFVELGLEIKRESPFARTMCIELANDYAGYIPTAPAFELGGYETWRARSSCLESGAGDQMVMRGAGLLKSVA